MEYHRTLNSLQGGAITAVTFSPLRREIITGHERLYQMPIPILEMITTTTLQWA